MTVFMISQSSRATTAAESRFRINNPNSKGRSSLVLGLGKSSMPTLSALSCMEWNGARFSCVVKGDEVYGSAAELAIGPEDLMLQSPNGDISRLSDELANTDVVIMFARSGESAQAAATVGGAAFSRNLMTAGFVLDEHNDRQGVEETLSALRPFVISLVVGPDEESFIETLSAIRA
jgi:hypothetical protein